MVLLFCWQMTRALSSLRVLHLFVMCYNLQLLVYSLKVRRALNSGGEKKQTVMNHLSLARFSEGYSSCSRMM
jgi:hypothetical protein